MTKKLKNRVKCPMCGRYFTRQNPYPLSSGNTITREENEEDEELEEEEETPLTSPTPIAGDGQDITSTGDGKRTLTISPASPKKDSDSIKE